MIYRIPAPAEADGPVLELSNELREQLRHRVAEPRRWGGTLRRLALARAVQASNCIEGYDATLDDVLAAVDGEQPLDADAETQFAVEGYRDAMTYVLQVAQDEDVTLNAELLKALHFMMMKHDLLRYPGRWRPGVVFVRREPDGAIVYEGPRQDEVPGLIEEMISDLNADVGPVLIRAAMAHLNLVMIHPFKDGNGRMARCLQTLVLARERIVAPVFSSIEEYLGRNTDAYYEILAAVGHGHWSPEHDARPWVRFCLTAHYRQAKTHLRRISELEELWRKCAALAQRHRLPERAVGALGDGAIGLRVRNATYRSVVQATDGEEISELTASRDLRAIVEAGLFEPIGEKRGRYYVGASVLTDVWNEIRNARVPREDDDPYELVQPEQLELGTVPVE